MSSDFSRSPWLLKGALVVFESQVPIPTNLIVFQYNPDTMTRGYRSPGTKKGAEGDCNACQSASPIETIELTIELDATDALEESNPLALGTGIHPTLAALELLVHPASKTLILNKALAKLGSAFLAPARPPYVLFAWGLPRVLPVKVTSVQVTEQAFDQLLNPIRAEVALHLETMSEQELKRAGPPFDTLATVNLIAKEALARLNIVNSAGQIAGMFPS